MCVWYSHRADPTKARPSLSLAMAKPWSLTWQLGANWFCSSIDVSWPLYYITSDSHIYLDWISSARSLLIWPDAQCATGCYVYSETRRINRITFAFLSGWLFVGWLAGWLIDWLVSSIVYLYLYCLLRRLLCWCARVLQAEDPNMFNGTAGPEYNCCCRVGRAALRKRPAGDPKPGPSWLAANWTPVRRRKASHRPTVGFRNRCRWLAARTRLRGPAFHSLKQLIQ